MLPATQQTHIYSHENFGLIKHRPYQVARDKEAIKGQQDKQKRNTKAMTGTIQIFHNAPRKTVFGINNNRAGTQTSGGKGHRKRILCICNMFVLQPWRECCMPKDPAVRSRPPTGRLHVQYQDKDHRQPQPGGSRFVHERSPRIPSRTPGNSQQCYLYARSKM